MTRSSNSFSASSFTGSSNSFGVSSFSGSSNAFGSNSVTGSSNSFSDASLNSVTSGIRKIIKNASLNGWSGDNITSDYFAQYGDFEGSYFGQGSFGGIRHFNK